MRIALAPPLLLALATGCGRSTPPAPPPSPSPSPSPASGAGEATIPVPDSHITFAEIGRAAGLDRASVSGSQDKRYILEANGPGVCALDFDRDGDEDLYIVDGQTLGGAERGRSTLWRNRGDGSFEDATEGSGTGADGWGFGCAVADIDQDGWPDLFVAAWKDDRLYRNRGDGSFEDISARAGVADTLWGESAAFADYDRDGLPDLYVTNYLRFDDPARFEPKPIASYLGLVGVFQGPIGLEAVPDHLYRNRGDGTFEDVSVPSGIRKPKPSYGLAVLFTDLDGDSWPDLYVANDSVANFFFVNQKDGTFVERGLEAGLAFNGNGKPQASMGIAFGDSDGDGRDDIFVTNFSDDTNTLYRNDGGVFVDSTWPSGLGAPSWSRLAWGTVFLDADADGALDLFVGDGHVFPQLRGRAVGTEYEQEDQLYRGDGHGKFTLVTAGELGQSKHLTRGAAAADLDRDGRLDLVTVRLHETPALYRNTSPGHAWLEPLLVGRDCNRDALGAVATIATLTGRIRRTVISGASYASQSQLRLHFGLGAATGRVEIEVAWPCGRHERFAAETGTFPTLVEGEGQALAGDAPPR